MQQSQLKKIRIATAIIVSVVVLLTIVLIYQFIVINNLRSVENRLAYDLEQMEEDIYNYSQENAYLQSPEFFEDYAREVLGWSKDGEVVYK